MTSTLQTYTGETIEDVDIVSGVEVIDGTLTVDLKQHQQQNVTNK
jgi:hypothetical protein